jgi:excisionase family DNA binding protein
MSADPTTTAHTDARPLLNADQAGRLLGVPASWCLREARADRIGHVRLGRYVRFSRGELIDWAQRRARGPRRGVTR